MLREKYIRQNVLFCRPLNAEGSFSRKRADSRAIGVVVLMVANPLSKFMTSTNSAPIDCLALELEISKRVCDQSK